MLSKEVLKRACSSPDANGFCGRQRKSIITPTVQCGESRFASASSASSPGMRALARVTTRLTVTVPQGIAGGDPVRVVAPDGSPTLAGWELSLHSLQQAAYGLVKGYGRQVDGDVYAVGGAAFNSTSARTHECVDASESTPGPSESHAGHA